VLVLDAAHAHAEEDEGQPNTEEEDEVKRASVGRPVDGSSLEVEGVLETGISSRSRPHAWTA